jgi:hypothetical protein
MINKVQWFGLFFELGLGLILVYVPPINTAFKTRPLPCAFFIVPAMVYFGVIFFYDEVRKIYVRFGIVRINGKIKYKGWLARNTYY